MIVRLVALCLLCLTAGPALARPPLYPDEVRAAFKKLIMRPDKPPLPLDIRKQGSKRDPDGNPLERVSIASEKKAGGKTERIPMLVVRPQKSRGRRPVVIVVHGTGGTKEGQLEFLSKLAGKGIIGVAIDARYHGERVPQADRETAYQEAIVAAWQADAATQEHPVYYDTVWDVWRVVDYLQKRPEVDKNRIGLIGFSMGGIVSWLAGATDERIKVTVPVIAVQSFRWNLDNNQWQARAKTIQEAHDAAAKDLKEPKVTAKVSEAVWQKLCPGLLDSFDAPSMLRLFAPRPLLILNGDEDPSCPIGGARIAFAAAASAYRAKEASEKLKVVVSPGVAHTVTDEHRAEALDFFTEWLKP
jgi:dienelactone hydrolase